jgi:DNA-binding MarR family transcriptional regulator
MLSLSLMQSATRRSLEDRVVAVRVGSAVVAVTPGAVGMALRPPLLVWFVSAVLAVPADLVERAGTWQVGLSTMSRTVDRLVGLGLAERRQDPADRRRAEFAVTAAGDEVGRGAAEASGRITARMASRLGEGELERLKDYLRRVSDALTP